MQYLKNKRWLITLVMSFVVVMCTVVVANAAVRWTSGVNENYGLNIKSAKLITYKNYLYSFGERDAFRIEIAKINDNGTLTDVTPPKAECPEIYFGSDVIAADSRTTALIRDDKLFVLFTRADLTGCYIKEYSLADDPAFPEFVCNYVPTLGGETSMEPAFNMAYVDGGIEYVDLIGNKYRFTKEGEYNSATKTYEAASAGSFVKNPYYTYSFTHNGASHTFYTNKNKIYYMDHAHESVGCADWDKEICADAKSISYNDGYVYVISLDNVLSAYAFNFSSTSANRTALKNKLSGEADATVSLDVFTSLELLNEISPVFENDIMYIAGNDAIVAIDVRNPSTLAIGSVIPCEDKHDSRTIGVYKNVLITKVYAENEKQAETFLIFVVPETNAVYEGNSVKVSINDMAEEDKLLIVQAVYGNINGIDKLDDFDYKEITEDGEYTLTADPGEKVITFVWRKDLTPIAKYIK